MRVAWATGLALAVLAASPARADEWTHQYPLKGGAELHVKTDDGSVRIETGAGSEIDARVTTVGWRIAPGEVTITESQTGDRVDIEVRLPKNRPGWGTEHRSITVALLVPKQADLSVHTGDGSIEVQADGLQGAIRLHTGDGSIRATGLSGRLEADTGDGGITLRLPEGLAADLDAHTGDGGIALDKPVTVTGTISPNTVRGKLGAGGLPLQIHTGDGSIRLMGL
jgi:hypothetical protein